MVNNSMNKSTSVPGDPALEGDDPFDRLLGYQIRRLSVLVMADLAAALAPLGIKPAAASILFAIAAQDGLTQSDIGRMLGIQRANMAPLIAGMMRQDLIERDALDGRSQSLRLSGAGQALQQEAWRRVLAHEDRLFSGLTADDRAALGGQIRTLWEQHAKDHG